MMNEIDPLILEFEAINGARIRRFLGEQQHEHLTLDFKEAPKGVSKEIRKAFAKAASGFANSAGGIILWGIRCKKTRDQDHATDIPGIAEPSRFIQGLEDATTNSTMPMTEGIRHEIVEVEADIACVKTLIPRSDASPHMAGHGEGRYFKRNGSSFVQLEHFDIEDMFGRRPRAILRPYLTVFTTGTSSNDTAQTRLTFGIENEGRGVAESPTIMVEGRLDNHVVIETASVHGLSDSRSFDRRVFQGASDLVIIPGTALDLATFRSVGYRPIAESPSLSLTLAVACKGTKPTSFSCSLRAEDVEAAIRGAIRDRRPHEIDLQMAESERPTTP